MKKLFALFALAVAFFTSCNSDVTPEIPVIKEYALTVLDQGDVPVAGVKVTMYMTSRPDFVITEKVSDIFGRVKMINLRPGSYFCVVDKEGTEIGRMNIQVGEDNGINVAILNLSNFIVPSSHFKVIVMTDRGVLVKNRKVDMLNSTGNVVFQSGVTDDQGTINFLRIPLGQYMLKVFDDAGAAYVTSQMIEVVADVTKNESTVEIVKLTHSADLVITGMLVDPSGTDCPAPGSVSGGGFAHPGEYEYIQLLALKNIDFSKTPYCIVVGNNDGAANNATYPAATQGWASSKGQNNKSTYQINITSGSVKQGEFFYVGGTSYMIASYYSNWGSPKVDPSRWFVKAFYGNRGDDDNGAAKGGSGLFNNLTSNKNLADGVALFKGTTIDATSIPQDVVFYGTEALRAEDRYQITDNDHYRRVNSKGQEQFYFGDGTNQWMAPQGFNDGGCFIMMGGQVTPTEWLKPRTGTLKQMWVKAGPDAVSLADIEMGENVTLFVNK